MLVNGRWRRIDQGSAEVLATQNAPTTVELDSRPVAVLSDPQYAEMFWDSYHIEAIVEDSEERRRILTDPEWWRYSHNGRLVYRSRALGMIADGAYEAGSVFDEDGRVVMRGLYLFVPEWANGPNMFERAMLWLRWLRGRSWSPRGE